MTHATIIRTGTDRNGDNWAQLQKSRKTSFGNIKVTAFCKPEEQLEVDQEVELTSEEDQLLRWEA